jgi:3-oxoacyl-[acyl-carrier protein] reductase
LTFDRSRHVAARKQGGPGYIDTDMTRALPQEVHDGFVSRIPLRRAGTPEEVAQVVLFLASDMSSYVSGQVLSIDGAMG